MNILRTRILTPVVLITVGIIAVFSIGMRLSSTPIALIVKVVPEVSKKAGASDWSKAAASDQLQSGDQVRTAQKALAILKFMDKSIVRVREQSLVMVTGDGSGAKFTKVVDLKSATIGFDIKKQTNEQFRFTSPTSVASIRGTKGKFTNREKSDTLIVVEGLVNLKNNISNKDLDIPVGFIGFSGSDGTLSSRQATQDELADATNAVMGSGEKELNLEMRDSKGNKKNLKIKIKQ
jgi:hypothetical protein